MNLEKAKPEGDEDYTNTISRLRNEFVVNHENYMSYLVRMKILGKIGFHLDYHKHMYKTRRDYAPDPNISDSYTSNIELNSHSSKLQRVVLPIGKRTIDMDIHVTKDEENYTKLMPFNPKDI
ncbi:uncharacterized protein LOC100163901 [Acyrthosiphon pisum]|uniref:Uncharacterized protein n=1 Tax=Acyrthosiphon pisum TaxID=7029 RepID=A0A8R2B445_ACYPI|nr:uncharacterized protein LOC100163901 [Acyrthosiphon pisum]|eukprot:XP_008180880.1 PREDICTED: uncharacterized protein LOC100163901 [Acyrthosiphon pisum]